MGRSPSDITMNWTYDELTWYQGSGDFNLTPWWQMDPESTSPAVNYEHEALKLGERSSNQTAIYRMGPIYWETLRRHPELLKLLRAINGTNASLLPPKEIKKRLEVLPKAQEAIVFYLATLCRSNWLDLSESVRARFDKFMREFCWLTPGTDGVCVIRSTNNVIDMLRASFDEFGHSMAISGFLQDVRVADLHPSNQKEEIPECVDTVKVLQISELDEELNKLGLKLMVLAVDTKASAAAAEEDFRRVFSKAFPEPKPEAKMKHRLEPDRLEKFSEFDRNGSYSEGDRKLLLSYFNEFSFDEIIRKVDGSVG